ncbi:MAG: hypothetical protein KDC54_15985, partial [Lewinella sp.]|nr:hypothetical protein [Lewinella sp.]
PGLTAADVVAVPIDYYPTNPAGADITLVTLAPDSIRWVLKNFALLSTRELGVGHPYTYAQIQFLLYSTIPPADLPPMSACIRFEDEFHDPVCTMPAAVISLTGTEKNAGIMACEVCADDVPALTDSVSCPPWWVWLLALVLILLLWWAYRRSRNPGN